MKQLNTQEVSQVSGGNLGVMRAVGNWLIGSIAWEAITYGFGSVTPRASLGGQMNQARRSNMYR